MARSAVIYCDEVLAHDTGDFHPESPLRIRSILDGFRQVGLTPPIITPHRITEENLLRVHTPEHLGIVERCCLFRNDYSDPDTIFMNKTWEAALLSAGAGITACQAILDGACDNAFVVMRPPGHHAERDYSMGFCVFNNIAIAARWLREVAGIRRVAIVDFDVHHGNGTQRIFYDDDSVFFVSLHEYPQYPGTGFPYERGRNNTTLNFQMPPGCNPGLWIDTIKQIVVPQLQQFAPDFLLISAGFDAHRLDPLGNQLLEAEHFGEMTRLIRHLAKGRIVSFLEGGYHLQALAMSSIAHFKALQGI